MSKERPIQLRKEDFLQAISQAVLRAVEGGTIAMTSSPSGLPNPISNYGTTTGILPNPYPSLQL